MRKKILNNVLDESIRKPFCKAALSTRDRNLVKATYTILNILAATFLKGEINFNILKPNIFKLLIYFTFFSSNQIFKILCAFHTDSTPQFR